ncbi:unnamed protein product [Ranitomeya imitator]|uniref:GIY-YIG domain-containing protein n=1 Tax=Ranitomeya imitator TaxID=111125 RepID=A0ABN9M376_9NEOB|nr:unnamed protein product [Ranitomeya imitator]
MKVGANPTHDAYVASWKDRVPAGRHLTWSYNGVIYHAGCLCNKIYVGLTRRELKIRVREHIRDIEKSSSTQDNTLLKTLLRHFKQFHNGNPRGLRIKGIDQVDLGPHGGDLGKVLARLESREDMQDGGKIISSDLSTLSLRKREEKREDMADRHSGILESREVTSGPERFYMFCGQCERVFKFCMFTNSTQAQF